jgi:hypothetical protein
MSIRIKKNKKKERLHLKMLIVLPFVLAFTICPVFFIFGLTAGIILSVVAEGLLIGWLLSKIHDDHKLPNV